MEHVPVRTGDQPPGFARQICPRCGSSHGFRAVTLQNDNTGCLLLLFGGIIPYLLYDSSRSNMLACEHCGTVFKAFVPTDWKMILIILGVFVALMAVGIFFSVINS